MKFILRVFIQSAKRLPILPYTRRKLVWGQNTNEECRKRKTPIHLLLTQREIVSVSFTE